MNNFIKKLTVVVLILTIFSTFVIPAAAAGAESSQILSVQNSFIQVLVNKDNGGFVIKTVEGSLLRKSDQNKKLLFQGDNFDTSFTTFRINDGDYIFGNHYGFLGLGGEFSTEPGTENLANVSVWKVGDIEIEQRLEVVNDISDPYIGNIVIKYKATNTGGSEADIGARLLLDTMLDVNDGAPFELGDGTGTRVEAEKRLTGRDVPDFWKAYDSFTMPSVAAYGFTSGWAGAKKPDEMVMAHWNDLAATKWDCAVNPLINFATIDNTFKTADSAAAMYWNPVSVPAGESVSFETIYGVMNYNAEETDAGFAVNSMAPRELELESNGNAYVDDGIFEVTLEIDNTLDNAQELSQLTAAISLEDGLELVPGEESGKYIDRLPANDTQVLKWTVKANVQSEYCVRKFKVDVTRSGFEPLAESGFILLPAGTGSPPEIQFNLISPERLYYRGDKYITIKGEGLDKYRDKGYWDLFIQPVDNPNGNIHIPDDNVVLSSDFKQITIIVSDELEVGEYELYFEWSGGFFPAGTIQGLPYKVMVTDNEIDRNDQYGILCIVKDENNRYALEMYKNEDELADASLDDALIIEIRGKIYDVSDEASGNSVLVDTSTDPVIINGIITYTGEMMTVNDEAGKITISGNGPIKVIGALTFWKWEWEMNFLDGEDYVLKDILLSGESPVRIELKGLGSILQRVGGFVMDIHYGVFRKMADGDDKFNTISFGGRMAIPLLPGSTNIKNIDSNDQNNSDESGTDVMVMDGITADVDNVLFGERSDEEPGFIGIDVTASVGLPENAFGGLVKNSFSAEVRINTIQNIYGASFAANLAVLDCEGELVLRLHEGKYPVPDSILFSAGGNPGVPVVPGIFYINKLGGGYTGLYNSIFGDSYMLPLTLHLDAGASLFDILDIEAGMELAMTHFSLEGNVTMLDLIPVMDNLSLYVSWVDGFYANARGTIYLYGGCVEGTASMTISDDFFEGWARVMLQVPNYIPIVGGFDLAGVEVGISTIKVWGKVICLGMAFGVVYYWETDNLDFIKGADVPPVTALGTFNTTDARGNPVVAYVGTNTRLITPPIYAEGIFAATDMDELRLNESGEFTCFAAVTPSNDRKQYTIDMTSMDGAVMQIEYYDEKPDITVNDPAGSPYTLIDGDITGDYRNANMRTQIIPADYEAGTPQHKYVIISVPPSGMKAGNWTLTATEQVEVSLIEVQSLPELTDAYAELSGNEINITWTSSNAGNAVVNIFLCEDEEESGIVLAKDISATDGSCTAVLPAALSGGTYYARVVMKMGDASFETMYAKNSSGSTGINYTNPNQPQPPSDVTASPAGSGYLSVEATHPDEENVDGYIVDVLDENGDPVASFGEQIFTSAQEIFIGGWQTSTPIDNSGAEPVELTPVYEGLEPGYNYQIRARAYKEVGEYKCVSEPLVSGAVFLPAPNPASITVTYGEGFTDAADSQGNPIKLTNLKETKISFAADMNVDAVVKADGSYYKEFSGNDFSLSIPLEDGNHFIDILTYNENNDYSCKKLAVTVDATPPDMLIASPLNGSLYTNGKLNINGTVEAGARYTIMVDGTAAVTDNTLTEFISNAGILDYNLDITDDQLMHSITISASDEAGNVTSYSCDVFNGDMGALSRVYIRAQNSSGDQVILKQGDTEYLELVGVDISGDEYILDSPQTQWKMLYGDGIADISEDRGLKGIESGEAVVLGSYSIADNYAYSDAIRVLVQGNVPVNHKPVAFGDLSYNVLVNNEIVINLNDIFSDQDNDSMTFTASKGTVTGSIWRYAPLETGTKSIDIYATDANGASVKAVLCITVEAPGNHVPEIVGGLSYSAVVNSEIAIDLNSIFNDPDNEPMTFTASKGTITGSIWKYTPAEEGTLSVDIYAADSKEASVKAVLSISVLVDTPENHAPEIVGELSCSAIVNSEIVINLNGIFSDPDNEPMTFTASKGTIAGSMWKYTPTEEGSVSIDIYATDTRGASVKAVLSISVLGDTPENHEPAIVGELSCNAIVNSEITINLNDIFSDPDNDPMTFTASKGTITGSIWKYTPAEEGTVSVDIYATDSNEASVKAVLSISVLEDNSNEDTPDSSDNNSKSDSKHKEKKASGAVTITNMDELIIKAVSEGSDTLIINTVDMNSGDSQVDIPMDMINKAKAQGVNTITISTALGNITFNTNSFETAGAESIRLDIGIADQAELSDAAKDTVGNELVYNIAISQVMPDNSLISVIMLDYPVTISLPYNLRPGDDPMQVTAFCLHPDGTLENMAGEYVGGFVTLSTNHLSMFLTKHNRVTFSDVPDDAWYGKEVKSLSAKGIIYGMGGGLFAPNENITRAQFALLVSSIMKLEPDETGGSFNDVQSGSWYAAAVNACVKAGIISDTGNNRFLPDTDMSRQDMAVILAKALNYADAGKYPLNNGDASLVTFIDKDNITEYALDMVGTTVKNGIIHGKPGNMFDPNGPTTRAESAMVIYILLKLIK